MIVVINYQVEKNKRITLARAILKNAPIIILDEATAFADTENEAKIEAAISEFVHNKTLIVIAHRLSSIINADQICIKSRRNYWLWCTRGVIRK